MGAGKSHVVLGDLIGEHAAAALSRAEPVQRVTLITGEQVWLATGYAEVKMILSDARFSAGSGPLHRTSWSHLDRKIGRLLHNDAPEHGRYRRLLSRPFSARRINDWEPRIREVTRVHLEVLAAQPRPADLVEHVATPIPEQIIHEMLGVPAPVRPQFRVLVEALLRRGLTAGEGRAATDEALDLMCQMLALKRARPADDLLTELTTVEALTDIEKADLAITVLMGGFLTITGMIAETVIALSQHTARRITLLTGDEISATAVEELLRYITVIHYGLDRVARVDVELGSRKVLAGDRVVAFLPAANEDPSLCPAPHELDTDRPRVRHASFGFGPHQCVGQQLARAELRVILTALLHRFPGIRLACPLQSLSRRTQTVIGGFDRLPVTW